MIGAIVPISTPICTTHTVWRRRLGGSGALSHGQTQRRGHERRSASAPTPAPTRPPCRTATPARPARGSGTASTSMSNRAPNALDVPWRRAAQPSKPSSTAARIAMATSVHVSARVGAWVIAPAISAVITARLPVMRFARPNAIEGVMRAHARQRHQHHRDEGGHRQRHVAAAERQRSRHHPRQRQAEPGAHGGRGRGDGGAHRGAHAMLMGAACRSTRTHSGWWHPAAGKSGGSRRRRRRHPTWWCARCSAGSAAGRSRSSSMVACRRQNTSGCARPFSRATSPRR